MAQGKFVVHSDKINGGWLLDQMSGIVHDNNNNCSAQKIDLCDRTKQTATY